MPIETMQPSAIPTPIAAGPATAADDPIAAPIAHAAEASARLRSPPEIFAKSLSKINCIIKFLKKTKLKLIAKIYCLFDFKLNAYFNPPLKF
jgi:hypothetical protein